MALHLCRDFYSFYKLNEYYTSTYLLAIFMKSVLNYTVHGQTTFNIEGNAILKASDLINASIQTTTKATKVQIPNSYTLSINDINRILVLKSNSYPTKNSGLFRIVAIETSTNKAIIDYRSPDDAPMESGLSWSIYENEETVTATFRAGTNTLPAPNYRSYGNSNASRIILTSPSSIAYQVRICNEAEQLYAGYSIRRDYMSISVGYDGNTSGDWQVAGDHTHFLHWYGKISAPDSEFATGCYVTRLACSDPGISYSNRYFFWGDDVDGTVIAIKKPMVIRNIGADFHEVHTFAMFGMTENEQLPLPSKNSMRIFNWGSYDPQRYENSIKLLTYPGNQDYLDDNSRFGWTQSYAGIPISAYPSFNSYGVNTESQLYGSYSSSVARDSTLLKKLELSKVDIFAGAWTRLVRPYGSAYNSFAHSILNEPRRIGTAKFLCIGRLNYNMWTTTSDDSKSWIHIQNGVYLSWNGPSLLP